MMLKLNCHPHQLIADNDSFHSAPNIPHLTHKVLLRIVSTTQVKAQIKTSYIPNIHSKHMNDIKHILPGYLCSNSDGINECHFGRKSKVWMFFARSRDTEKCIPLACREDERGAVRCHGLAPARISSFNSCLARFKLGQHVSVRTCRRLLGLMAAASPVLPLGLLHMRPFLWWIRLLRIRSTGPATRLIRVSRSCFHTLLIWRNPTFLQSGVRMGEIHHRHMVTMEASK